MKNDIMVSVCMITYNHEKYIRQAIEGVLMQKTDFPIELVIGEDCSTDATRDICLEYQNKYPSQIRLLVPEHNLGMHKNFICTLKECTGKYIALCEGDDYWIDLFKLQKQVDFLEAHTNYSLTCGGYLYGNSKKKIVLEKGPISFDLKTYTKWYTKTLTVVFRHKFLKSYMNDIRLYRYSRDIHLFYYLLKQGKGYYFTDILGVYNVHEGGVCSMVPPLPNAINGYNCYKELYENNENDEFCRRKYFESILWVLYNRTNLLYNFKFLKDGISISKGMKEIMCLLLYNLPIRYLKKYLDMVKLMV